MKKSTLVILCAFIFAFTGVFGRDLTGTYDLIGTNSRTGKIAYRGEVIIEPFGANYRVIWMVGSSQIQAGIGLLNDDQTVLSVSYKDTSKDDCGVVSFDILSSYELEGKWASMNSTSYGRERLVWVSPYTD